MRSRRIEVSDEGELSANSPEPWKGEKPFSSEVKQMEKNSSWRVLEFSSEELLNREYVLDLPDMGFFIVDKVKINVERKALLLTGTHEISGEEKKAELSAFLKVEKADLKELSTAGQALRLPWEDYTIDYCEEDA